MLTGALLRVKFSRDLIIPRYIDVEDADNRLLAEGLLQFFHSCVGRTRGELEAEVAEEFGDDPGMFLLRGLTKLLEDRCEFAIVAGKPPEEVRDRVFRIAATARASGPVDRTVVLTAVASEMAMGLQEVEDGLFADLKSEQRLSSVEATTAERLLHRYNLGLAQAVLLKATAVRIAVRSETPARLRRLFRQIKFHRLMCEVKSDGPKSVALTLDGPMSLFSATQKYGLQLALFLPTILNCRDFELEADLQWGPQKTPKRFVLTHEDRLVSQAPETGTYVPPEANMFAEQFRKRVTDWELLDETDAIPLGEGYWVPDFRLVHRATGKSLGLEVLGFWRKSGAEAHLARLRKHATMPFLIALSDSLKIDDSEFDESANIVRFKQVPLAEVVMSAASQVLGIK